MTFETGISFYFIWLLAAAAPGPNVAFTIATGLSTPLPRALLAPVGIGLGGLVYALGVSAGLGTLLKASAEAFAVVKWVGVAYLVWLGVRQWQAAGRSGLATTPVKPKTGPVVCLQAFVVMVSNPKAALAYAAIFPAFIEPGGTAWQQFALLSGIAAAASVTVHCSYILLAARLGGWQVMRARPALVHRASGTIYLLAAAALALVRRGVAAA
jgi:homoserine/homoserine lactone efflux protein